MDDLYAGGDTGNSPEQGGEEEGGYCIKIYVGPDNQVKSVAVKRESESQDEQQPGQVGAAGEAEGEDFGTETETTTRVPASSIEDAMTLVMKAYESQGQLPTGSDQGEGQGNAMADMMQGYGRGGLRGQSEGMGVRKVFR